MARLPSTFVSGPVHRRFTFEQWWTSSEEINWKSWSSTIPAFQSWRRASFVNDTTSSGLHPPYLTQTCMPIHSLPRPYAQVVFRDVTYSICLFIPILVSSSENYLAQPVCCPTWVSESGRVLMPAISSSGVMWVTLMKHSRVPPLLRRPSTVVKGIDLSRIFFILSHA